MTEGGHVDLAPRDERELGLWQFLRRKFPHHVSLERAVSGPGLVDIYRYLVESGRPSDPRAAGMQAQIEQDFDAAPAVISSSALQHRCPVCAEAFDLFVTLYGAAAGNLALSVLARAGVYLGGGIAPQILPALRRGPFLDAFRAKEPLVDLLATIPVSVILYRHAGLIGASVYANLKRLHQAPDAA